MVKKNIAELDFGLLPVVIVSGVGMKIDLIDQSTDLDLIEPSLSEW